MVRGLLHLLFLALCVTVIVAVDDPIGDDHSIDEDIVVIDEDSVVVEEEENTATEENVVDDVEEVVVVEEEEVVIEEEPEPLREINFQLRGDIEMTIDQDEVKHYKEPGWVIGDENVESVLVYYTLPAAMRNGEPGTYTVVYYAQSESGDVLATKERIVTVVDIDECQLGRDNCSENADCINTIGSFECKCKDGFRGNGIECVDIDECREETDTCDRSLSTCVNLPGSYTCQCHPGYRMGEDDRCVDIDECFEDKHNCDQNAECINIVGSYTCECNEGWEGDGFECTPENPCKENDCHPEYAICEQLGEDCDDPADCYRCTCKRGFEGDGRVCEDINECERDLHDCGAHSYCVNLIGGYTCPCSEGYEDDGYGNCVDIDECARGIHKCSPYADCTNTDGSYTCKCKPDFEGDGFSCRDNEQPSLIFEENPLVIAQFEEYAETGFELADNTMNADELRVSVKVPRELDGVATQCGTFEVEYRFLYRGKTFEPQFRTVIVEPTNQCELPRSHPFSSKCSRFANCIFNKEECDYTCECHDGYSGDGLDCKDTTPPVIVTDPYADEETPFVLYKCIVCGGEVGHTPDPSKPLGPKNIYAYDPMPNEGRIQVPLGQPKIEPHNETYAVHTYTAVDEAGLVTVKTFPVIVEADDMFDRINRMNATINRINEYLLETDTRFSEFKSRQERTTDQLSSFVYWIVGVFALVAAVKVAITVWAKTFLYLAVTSASEPQYQDFEEAFSFWLRVRHPLWSREQIDREVFAKWAERQQ